MYKVKIYDENYELLSTFEFNSSDLAMNDEMARSCFNIATSKWYYKVELIEGELIICVKNLDGTTLNPSQQ